MFKNGYAMWSKCFISKESDIVGVQMSLLDKAKESFFRNDRGMECSLIERAQDEGYPAGLLRIRKNTLHHMVFPFDNISMGIDYSIEEYFSDLKAAVKLMEKGSEYEEEAIKALNTLVNIKRLFVRTIGLQYFSDVAKIDGGSLLIRQLDVLQDYIKENYEDIATNDVYKIKMFLPAADFNKFKTDLLKVRAYCLNLLLSYTELQGIRKIGEKYNVEFTQFDRATVSKSNDYATWAVIEPRLYYLEKEAYYDVYLSEFNSLCSEINRFEKFDSPKELRQEIKDIVNHRRRDKSDKEFFKYAVRFEKDDVSRMSLLNMNSYIFPWVKQSPGYVGGFELNQAFARKRVFGVCAMISAWRDWNLETVRAFTLLLCCTIVGFGIYLLLAICIKLRLYLPGLIVREQ